MDAHRRHEAARAGRAAWDGAWSRPLGLARASVYPFSHRRDASQEPDSAGRSDLGCAQGNGEETMGHQGAALLGAGTQKGAVNPHIPLTEPCH